jgi:tRNA threonylcarbamoyladenosine biosynthesis protein TsaE
MEHTYHAALGALHTIARDLLLRAGSHRLFALYGPMGSGKTTLTAHLAKAVGVQERIQSPTFALVREYLSANGEPVYHFDFYRIQKPNEALDLGCDMYFYSGYYCFIEWPERLEHLLPPGCATICMEMTERPDTRKITLTVPDRH